MLILGVDPGVRGGWAMLRLLPDGRPRLEQYGTLPVMPGGREVDVIALARLWRGTVWAWEQVVAVVEGVGARPRQGVASTWAFGRATGAVEGVLAGLGVMEYRRPGAAAWKASYGLGKAKAQSSALAERLMGAVGLTEHEAEAALLAWWLAQRVLRGED